MLDIKCFCLSCNINEQNKIILWIFGKRISFGDGKKRESIFGPKLESYFHGGQVSDKILETPENAWRGSSTLVQKA